MGSLRFTLQGAPFPYPHGMAEEGGSPKLQSPSVGKGTILQSIPCLSQGREPARMEVLHWCQQGALLAPSRCGGSFRRSSPLLQTTLPPAARGFPKVPLRASSPVLWAKLLPSEAFLHLHLTRFSHRPCSILEHL